MRRIAIVNLKGGTAKTVTATALAASDARRGLWTLLVDADAQVLLGEASAAEAVRPTLTPGLDLLPAAAPLNAANVGLVQRVTGRDT